MTNGADLASLREHDISDCVWATFLKEPEILESLKAPSQIHKVLAEKLEENGKGQSSHAKDRGAQSQILPQTSIIFAFVKTAFVILCLQSTKYKQPAFDYLTKRRAAISVPRQVCSIL